METIKQQDTTKQIQIYYAPMEGITGVHYRRMCEKHFPYVDKYYAPFVQPNQKKVFTPKEKRDVLPENNDGITLVPQVLTCVADGFIRAGKALEDYGYREINLNLGCPSGTVVSKGKGAGMLEDPDKLDRFFDAVFSADWKASISVKTRLGMDEKSDHAELIRIFQKYPISELIVHARYRSDFYRGEPRTEEFEGILKQYAGADTKLCYNGNIFSVADYDRIIKDYGSEFSQSGEATSRIHSVMIGRGLLANPALAREIRGGKPLEREELLTFHDDIFAMYSSMDLGEKNTLFKMKELWNYWGTVFTDADKELKKVRKAIHYSEYLPAVHYLFDTCELTKTKEYRPC